MKKFGEHLKALRTDAAMTQADLAETIGVSNAYISALEKGKKPAPPHALVTALATSLGTDEDGLWAIAQKEREERLRARIDGVPTSLRRRKSPSAAGRSAKNGDPLDRAMDALQEVAQDAASRKRLAHAIRELVDAARGEP